MNADEKTKHVANVRAEIAGNVAFLLEEAGIEARRLPAATAIADALMAGQVPHCKVEM